MSPRDWFRPPRHLLALFVAATVLPALALGGLAWVSIGQDAALDRQRHQDMLDAAAGRIVSELQRQLDDAARQVVSLGDASNFTLPEDSVFLTITDERIADHPAGRLLYYPRMPAVHTPRDAALEAAAALEFKDRNLPAAAAVFRGLAASSRQAAAVRAAAMIGLARCLRQSGRQQEALAVYSQLAGLDTTTVEGDPAELVARHARCTLLAEMKSPDLQTEAVDLLRDLQSRRWAVDRAAFDFYAGQARAWLPSEAASQTNGAQLALANSAVDVDTLRRQQNGLPGRGAAMLWRRGRPLLLVWQNAPSEMRALVAGASWFERQAAGWAADNLAVTLTGADAHLAFGSPDRLLKPVAMQSMTDTGLPWTVRVSSADPAKVPSLLARSRRTVFGGLAVVGVMIIVGGFLVARALGRELAVARLQSDFVAAVSHEFRSPLTSMKHLIEMLDEGAVPSEDRRRQYYRVLHGEADRLHQMVEDLLNFGRMEAGKAEYRFEPLDVYGLIRDVAAGFEGQLVSSDRLIVRTDALAVYVDADREALSRALRNLLDNAAKYSPPTEPLEVILEADAASVRIRVRDRGAGIPRDEQKAIFTKFYRGAGAKTSGAKGTGLGLAAVQYIVRAHHGDIVLDSAPGQGSTFTLVLPVAKGAL